MDLRVFASRILSEIPQLVGVETPERDCGDDDEDGND